MSQLQENSDDDNNNNNNNNNNNKPMCHILPCSIDFSGRVPGGEILFQPTPLSLSQPTDNHEPKGEEEGHIYAASLRGRGLLGRETAIGGTRSDPRPASLRVFKVSHKGNTPLDQEATTITVEGPAVQHVMDWQHEHIPDSLNNAHSKSRLVAAHNWYQVAQALHEPLPPPEQF